MLYSRLISRIPERADRPRRFPFRRERTFAFRPASAAHKVPDIRPIADTIRRRRVRVEKKAATRGECITRRVCVVVAARTTGGCLFMPSPAVAGAFGSSAHTPYRPPLSTVRGGSERETHAGNILFLPGYAIVPHAPPQTTVSNDTGKVRSDTHASERTDVREHERRQRREFHIPS